MPQAERLEFLTTVPPFGELDREAVAGLAALFRDVRVAAGERVGEFAPPGRAGLYVLREGAVVLLDPDGTRLEQRGEGELFGHAIALDHGQGDYTVEAVEDCLLWHMAAEDLARVMAAQPSVAHFLTAAPGELLRAAGGRSTGTLVDLRLRPPVTSAPDMAIAECAGLMARHQVSCLPVLDREGLVGILTDRDLRTRVLARGVDPSRPVAEVMTRSPLSVPAEARIDDALVEMLRLGIHHLPVLDQQRRLVGVVSAGDLLRLQAPHPLRLVRDIQRASGRQELVELARQGPGLLAALTRQGSAVTEVGRIASLITDACTRRLIELAQVTLGEAPMGWTWLSFGSQARMEQGLVSDQDNGLLLAEVPDPQAAEYFLRLAESVCDGLDACGYAHCPGGVMAKGRWRLPLADWRRTFTAWMREPTPESVLNSSIFFDLRPVAGDLALAQGLQAEVLAQAQDSRIFLRFLAAEALTHTPPLGLFRQFVQERDGRHSQGLNLKKRGVLPIVDLARVRALEAGVAETHTEARFVAAARAGGMNERDADDLAHAYRFIGNVRLRHQAWQHERGETPDHLVDPEELSGLHRRYLRTAFGLVRAAQRALAQRYSL